MNSLVGYGVSSDSDSEAEAEDSNIIQQSATKESEKKKSRNFLLGSTSSESEPEDAEPECSSPLPPQPRATPASTSSDPSPHAAPPPACPTVNKLPPPSLTFSSDSSVFANPFKAQVEQKLFALQKHVPLTMQAKPSQIGGKKMCVSYRKDGRCRFGIKCKFAHDSDLQTQTGISVSEEISNSGGGAAKDTRSQPKQETSEEQQSKKRRVGVSNTLIPPKRAMKQYAMQRKREQIKQS